MILGRRWQQVTEQDPLNPYQRRMIRPAYGNVGEGAHGTFFFNPMPTDNFQIMDGRYPLQGPVTTEAVSTVKWLGLAVGIAAGVWYGLNHF
jgi:hypothetical protein